MKKIIPFLFISLVTITLPSCWKESRFQCDTWEYYDECTPKNPGIQNCVKGANIEGTFCDADRNGITAGGSRILFEDADRKVVRHFVAKKN